PSRARRRADAPPPPPLLCEPPPARAPRAPPAAPPADHPEQQATGEKEPKRRALPAPLPSPPFPSSEWQGYSLIGVPVDTTRYPLMQALQGTWEGDLLDSSRTRVYGWINPPATPIPPH